jgi:hypothetical protein
VGDVFGSGDGGKKGGGDAGDAGMSAADTLAALAANLYGETDTVRTALLGIFQHVLEGQRPSAMNFTGPEREAIEGQFRNARENIIENTPARGGQMNQLLGQAEIGRAQAVSGLDAEIRRAALQGATQAAFGTPGPAFQGLAGAGNTYASLAQTTAGANQAKQDMGALAGAALCWVAAAIYGDDSREFVLARRWIRDEWQGPVADVVRRLYVIVGPHAAPYVRRWPWLRSLLKPLFDVAVRKAGG